ncbi:MAG: transposase [Candidatus Colwellbacteria bacterium]
MASIVHTLSRGVDKREIFLDDQDRFRFVHNLFEFNDEEWVSHNLYLFNKNRSPDDIASRHVQSQRKPRKLLVDILAFCLMGNHYHLLLSPRVENGVSKFMKKLNMGYAKYFNIKYKRVGTLFQSRYKSVPITNDPHLLHIPYYIHFNPLDFSMPGWRNREILDYKEALHFLEGYRWSSHLDYLGKDNFPSVTNRGLLTDLMGEPKEYQKSLSRWLRDIDIKNLSDFTLEPI